MRKSKLLLVCVVVVVMLVALLVLGCGGQTVEQPPEEYYEPPPEQTYAPPVDSYEPPAGNGNGVAPVDVQPPRNITWISPGKVMVANFHLGARAEYPLTIHNGNDGNTSFSIYYRYPDHVGEEYYYPPLGVQDWVIVADPTPVLVPQETRDILVSLIMPEDANVTDITLTSWVPPKWEFWVGVMDTTQTGMVKTELCVRWLVTMR